MLLGRPWVHDDRCVLSSWHQCIKVAPVKGSQIQIGGLQNPFALRKAHFIETIVFSWRETSCNWPDKDHHLPCFDGFVQLHQTNGGLYSKTHFARDEESLLWCCDRTFIHQWSKWESHSFVCDSEWWRNDNKNAKHGRLYRGAETRNWEEDFVALVGRQEFSHLHGCWRGILNHMEKRDHPTWSLTINLLWTRFLIRRWYHHDTTPWKGYYARTSVWTWYCKSYLFCRCYSPWRLSNSIVVSSNPAFWGKCQIYCRTIWRSLSSELTHISQDVT